MPWKNKEKIKAYKKKHRLINHKKYKKYSLKYRHDNKNKIKKWHKQHRLDMKLKAYDIYGGRKCSWCGEDDIAALNIDHINNNATTHRDNKGYKIQGTRLYTWLAKHCYPSGFQVLCWNCNFAKSFNNGILPAHRANLHDKK